MYTGDDFYCDMVFSGKLEVDTVLETGTVLAYHHTRPYWPVHIVVVPKRHIASLLEVDDRTLLELFAAIKEVAAEVSATQGACRILSHLGTYQDSKHLHWHVCAGEPLR